MSCTCNQNPCCCEKVISVRGLKGEKGERGLQGLTGPTGPPGPSGSSVAYLQRTTDTQIAYPGDDSWVDLTSYTVTVAGNYLIFHESTHFLPSPSNGIIYINVEKNGVLFNAFFIDFVNYQVQAGNGDQTRKVVMNLGYNNLLVGDVIKVQMKSAQVDTVDARSTTFLKVDTLTVSLF